MEIVTSSGDETDNEFHDALNALMDISVSEADEEALLDSRYNARIQIELNIMPSNFGSRYLRFFSSHTRGRGTISSVLDDGTLLMTFGVLDASEVNQQLVRTFANDITRVLGQPESSVFEAEIIQMTDQRLARILTAMGIRRPDLKIVESSDD